MCHERHIPSRIHHLQKASVRCRNSLVNETDYIFIHWAPQISQLHPTVIKIICPGIILEKVGAELSLQVDCKKLSKLDN